MRKCIIGLVLLFMLLVPGVAKAAAINVTLNCPASATLGSTINCDVRVNSSVVVTGLKANYKFSNVSYVGFTPNSGFSTYYASNTGFSVGSVSGKSGNYSIGTLKVKVSGAGSVSLTMLDASDKNDKGYAPANAVDSIRIKSTDANLKSLAISSGTLSPSFNAGTTSYSATVAQNTVTISAVASNGYAKVSGAGKKSVAYGKNTFKITVTAESGAKKTYTIVINRPDNRSTNNYLRSLSVDKGTINFSKNNTSYNINVEENVDSITVNAAYEDSRASFVNGFGSRKVALKYGNNPIEIRVKAQNETVKTYTINVNRKDNRSTDNYLESLTIKDVDIPFNKHTLEYNVTVYYQVTKLDIMASAVDSKSKVEVLNKDLFVGNNVVLIRVTAENEQVREYKLNIRRLSEDEKMSDNNKIENITIPGHDIDFKSDVTEYDISIFDEYALVFEIAMEDEKASYVIDGNRDLKDGSVIKVTSTSESGKELEYRFNVSKTTRSSDNTTLKWIFAGVGFIGGIFATLVISLLKKTVKVQKVS